MQPRRAFRLPVLVCVAALQALALKAQTEPQILEFESGGLRYKAQTRNGVTIMFAPLPLRVLGYSVLQIAVSNGSPVSWTFQPEDFQFEREGGVRIRALPSRTVVGNVLERAGRGDIVRLVAAYEAALTGNAQVHSTNGYEMRRQDAMAMGGGKLRAAAATSAIVLVLTKLQPGQSTDGAIFYDTSGKPLGAGRLIINAAGETFEFPVSTDSGQRPDP
jgi:hypothetical protein